MATVKTHPQGRSPIAATLLLYLLAAVIALALRGRLDRDTLLAIGVLVGLGWLRGAIACELAWRLNDI